MPADIIVLAAIAIFVLLRLRAVLGHKIGHDQPPPVPRDLPDESDRVVQVQPRTPGTVIEGEAHRLEPSPEAQAALAKLPDDIRQGVEAITKIDPGFSMPEFLKGARGAFDMVLEAYSRDDQDTLKMLLAKDVFENFKKELETAKKSGQHTETTLVSILSSEPVEARLQKNVAYIAVKFESEQIQIVRDANGKIVDGDASDIQIVEDEWAFERDLRSSNPNWKIVGT
jgi:predicted lipid-binding transport protein (Tim44 family)